jgi:hypothetical protein
MKIISMGLAQDLPGLHQSLDGLRIRFPLKGAIAVSLPVEIRHAYSSFVRQGKIRVSA